LVIAEVKFGHTFLRAPRTATTMGRVVDNGNDDDDDDDDDYY
jgi:hypothetical protein